MDEEAVGLGAIQKRVAAIRGAADALRLDTAGDLEGERERIQDLQRAIVELDDNLQRHIEATMRLRESEKRFQLLVAAVEDYAIFMLDPRGVVVSWNLGAQRIKGYTAEEIVGQHFSRFYLPEDVAAGKPATVLSIAAQWGHYSEEGWRMRKDGSRFWASVIITAIYNAAGQLQGFGKVTRDMTERKVAEETLRQSEERFRLLVEGVRDYAIFMLDHEGYVSSWNAGAQQIKGYTANEIVGKHFSTFYPPEDLAAGKPAWELTVAKAEGRYEEEGWRIRKDGSRFWASVLITALYDATGQFRGFAKVTRDLTERKLAEQERELLLHRELELERERDTRRRMEAAVQMRDQFLAVVSHELKTPLTTILVSAQLQQRRLANNTQVAEAEQQRSQTLVHQVLRMQRLINSLLDLTRLQDGRISLNMGPVNLADIAQRLADELRPTLTYHELDLLLPAEPVVINGDRDRLEQVVQNLLHNAVKYSPEGGRIGLEVELQETQACLTISDQGIGIPVEEIDAIFERFYRASNVEQTQLSGMGVGLYVAKEIISRHGGTLEVTSEPGAGSRFCLCLPRNKD